MRISTAPAVGGLVRGRSRFAKLAVVAAATTAVAAGGLVGAAPASAHPSCDPGSHCQFFLTVGSSRHQEPNSDPNLSDDTFDNGAVVNNNSESASNSSTGNFESHYYDGFNFSGFLYCINPGNAANLPASLKNRASSLQLRPRTAVVCLA